MPKHGVLERRSRCLNLDKYARFCSNIISAIPILDILVEENEKAVEEAYRFIRYKSGILAHKANHGDIYALALFEIELAPVGLPPEVFHVSNPFLKLARVVEVIHSIMKYPLIYAGKPEKLGEVVRKAKELRDKLVSEILKLKPNVRAKVVKEIGKWVPEKVFNEVFGVDAKEILSKTRIEVKIVLKPEEALKLARRYGKAWKQKIRERVEELVKTMQTTPPVHYRYASLL